MKRKSLNSLLLLPILLTSCSEAYSGHVECPSFPEGDVYYEGFFVDSDEKSLLFPLKADEGLQERDIDSVTLSMKTIYQSAETTFSLEEKEGGYLIRIDCPENMDFLDTVDLKIGGKDYSYPVDVVYFEIEPTERDDGSIECLSVAVEESPTGREGIEITYRVCVEKDGILGIPTTQSDHPLREGVAMVVSTTGEKASTLQNGVFLQRDETYLMTIFCEDDSVPFFNENVPFPFVSSGTTTYLIPENDSISSEILLKESNF